MIKIKVILAAFMAVFTVTSASAARDEMVAYLFTYFNSNAPEDEQICYAISDDGYNYIYGGYRHALVAWLGQQSWYGYAEVYRPYPLAAFYG